MSRGVLLERDIIEQEFSDKPTLQHRVLKDDKPYCSATLDGYWIDMKHVIEVKTSIYSCPSMFFLIRKYPQYYMQVQWQLWVSGAKTASIIWCKCPEDYDESPYDENGMLDVSEILIEPDQSLFDVFEENAPVFWKLWTEAKEKNG